MQGAKFGENSKLFKLQNYAQWRIYKVQDYAKCESVLVLKWESVHQPAAVSISHWQSATVSTSQHLFNKRILQLFVNGEWSPIKLPSTLRLHLLSALSSVTWALCWICKDEEDWEGRLSSDGRERPERGLPPLGSRPSSEGCKWPAVTDWIVVSFFSLLINELMFTGHHIQCFVTTTKIAMNINKINEPVRPPPVVGSCCCQKENLCFLVELRFNFGNNNDI